MIPKRDAPVKLIKVYLFYTNNANTAYFDNISLVREPCSSYSYDDKGNPVSAKEGGAKTDCEYESGTSILTKYTASTGVVTNFTYESGTHNLLTTTSAGVTSTNTYNAMGLVNTTTTSSSDQSLKQQSSAVYDPYGRKTSSTDVNNITTTNTYINHFLTSTQTGNMPAQEYRYNVSDGRMNQTFMSGYAIQHYLYENGQLSDLSRKGKVNGSDFWQSYHFEYDSFGNMTCIGVSSANKDDAKDVTSDNYHTLASYTYEPGINNGRLKTMTYGNGNTVSYEYDIFDRTTKETYNNGVVYNYAYDASGALAKQWSNTGEEYRYEYDSLGRLIRSSEYNGGEFTQRTEHIYDESDRLTLQTWYNGSGTTSQTYAYSDTSGLLTELGTYFPGNPFDATPGASNTPSVSIAYNYNGLNTLSGKTVSAGGSTVYSTNYSYSTFTPAYTTNLVSELSYGGSLSDLTRQYTYDANGNIKTVSKTTSGAPQLLETYTYDGQNQLVRCDSAACGKSYTYTYDTAGNIRKKQEYAYTTGELGAATKTVNYAYSDGAWADLLTSYDGHNIAYEGQTYTDGDVTGTPSSGNPTHYYNGSDYNFEWTQGRRLATAVKGSTSVSYDYDMAGVRSGKTVTTTDASTGETTTTHYKYITLSGKVMRQSWDGNVIDFIYDENNQPFAMRYKASGSNNYATYYYILNVQGDVVGLMDQIGNQIVQYNYDPWGKLLSINTWGELPGENEWYLSIAEANPLRYRGYYYDTETGLYYLQSRYYDPEIGRFINADTYTTTDTDGLLSTNMFAYCENNPVMGTDPTGEWFVQAAIIGAVVDAASYLVGCALSGEEATWEGVGKAALKGAVTGVAFGAAGKIVGKVAGKTISAIKTAKYTTGSPNKVGKIGEQISGIVKNTEKYLVNGRTRIPDGVTPKYIQEVKNVKRLSYTSQIRDSIQLANDTGRRLQLFVRPNTYLSGPLRDAISTYNVSLKYLW